MSKKIIFGLFIFCCLSFASVYAGQYQQVSGIIHVQSRVSDGDLSIEEIAKRAHDKRIAAVFINDHDLKKWSYGFGFFRNIFKKSFEEGSILKFGPARYLAAIQEAQSKYPDVLMIPGVECAPFYYWEGSVFGGNLRMRAWHRHILAIDLEKPKDYLNLPLIENGKSRFDQYHGDKWYKPYQDLIDYVDRIGGMTFWAHPEAQNSTRVKGVLIETLPYPELLLDNQGYTGFSILNEGYQKVGNLGGIWDTILSQYCRQERAKPIWAIGEEDFEGKNAEAIDHVKNIFLVKEINKKAILEALKKGRLYVVTPARGGELKLDEFSLTDSEGGKSATMGQELVASGKVTVNISLSANTRDLSKADIKLIKNGKLLKIYQENLPFKLSFIDEEPQGTAKSYYRLDVTCRESKVISNPIFCSR
jgi:hypothetical protein